MDELNWTDDARAAVERYLARVAECSAASLAPESGSPLSLHQAAEAMSVDRKLLEKSLRNAVRFGEMLQVTKNRFLPLAYAGRLARAAETLAESSPDGEFTVAAYCETTATGRNFAIELLEYFDRLGFTRRENNRRRIRRSAASVFQHHGEGSRGRGSHPGGAPGLQIR